MRARLRAAGEWRAHEAGLQGLSDADQAAQEDVPDIAPPDPEDSESSQGAKRPRLEKGASGSDSEDSIPPLEGSPTPEGIYFFIFSLRCLCGQDPRASRSCWSAIRMMAKTSWRMLFVL